VATLQPVPLRRREHEAKELNDLLPVHPREYPVHETIELLKK
jgi:hypothetical protein